jgi:sRNA-binding carbon storage regulator CsrA
MTTNDVRLNEPESVLLLTGETITIDGPFILEVLEVRPLSVRVAIERPVERKGHLQLTRNRGETIHANGPCEISLEDISGGSAAFGCVAPLSTHLRRGELVPQHGPRRPEPRIVHDPPRKPDGRNQGRDCQGSRLQRRAA